MKQTHTAPNPSGYPSLKEAVAPYAAMEQHRELRKAADFLETVAAENGITLWPASTTITTRELRDSFPSGPVVVCDAYVKDIEKGGLEHPWGYEKDGIINIDHHAPTETMTRMISSGVLAGHYVRKHGSINPNTPVLINHTDCDSIISSLTVRGLIPPHPAFDKAVIAADHTGEADNIARLLQALEKQRDPELCIRALARELKGEPQLPATTDLLRDYSIESEIARCAVETGSYQKRGRVVLIKPSQKVGSEFFMPFLPDAVLIISATPRKDNGRWDIKLRLGQAAPVGFSILNLSPAEFDPAFGGRWNAGATGRGGGSHRTPEEYLEYYSAKITSTEQI